MPGVPTTRARPDPSGHAQDQPVAIIAMRNGLDATELLRPIHAVPKPEV